MIFRGERNFLAPHHVVMSLVTKFWSVGVGQKAPRNVQTQEGIPSPRPSAAGWTVNAMAGALAATLDHELAWGMEAT